MSKHQIFLVHGMGKHDADWSAGVKKALRDSYATYPQLAFIPFDQRFEFVPIRYDDEFEALREMWRNSAKALGDVLSPLQLDASLLPELQTLTQATDKDTFINTHLLDVLLYRFARQTAATVREKIRSQIFEALNKLSPTEPRNWSVIAHSLGTAVIHDTLHEAYSDRPTKFGEKLSGLTRPTLLAMIANVSRLLSSDIDVYLSRTKPGNPDDIEAACRFYLSASHALDPFTQPKAFRPQQEWPSAAIRAKNLFVSIETSDIEALNVHDIVQYLNNPKVHVPIFNCMLDQTVVSQSALDTAHAQYTAELRERLRDQAMTRLQQELKAFELRDNSTLRQALEIWAQFRKVVA